MNTKTYQSEYKNIPFNNELVFEKLSNFRFLDFVFSSKNIDKIKAENGGEKSNINVKRYSIDNDACEFTISPIGTIGLVIDKKNSSDFIRIKNVKGPVKFNIELQIEPVDSQKSKIQITLSAELNMMMQMMIGKKVGKIVDKVASSLAQIPFDKLA